MLPFTLLLGAWSVGRFPPEVRAAIAPMRKRSGKGRLTFHMVCGHCGTRTKSQETTCHSCGHRLGDAPPAVAAGVLTPPPPSIGDPDAEEVGTLLADTLVAPPQTSTPGSETLAGEPPPVDDLTRLPAPEHAATLVAPTNRRATDRGRHTGTGKLGSTSRGKSGPLEVGQDFGPRYHIIRVLGVGGMGAVYQAWDAELTEAVAVKVIRPEIAADPRDAADIERRFKRELLLARQVTHKNVVRIHDLGEIDGIKYITMTYVVGADLATILKQESKLPVPRALRIARGMVSGLVSAHQAGVVHRDLKPANIMVGADDEPTIMDFGIARSTGQDSQSSGPVANLDPADLKRYAGPLAGQTMAGAIIGTVEYMSPEQAKGQPADQRSDVYAFGLILYDMLVGRRRKQRAESALDELYAPDREAAARPCTLNKEIPAALNAITLRCLEPDAGKRFQTTAELQSAFDRLDENGKPLPIMQRVSRRTMAMAAALVLMLLGGTFYTAQVADGAAGRARSRVGGDRRLSEHHQRSDVRHHAGADGAARARRRQLHQRVRSHQDLGARRAAAGEAGRSRGARAGGEAGPRSRARRIDPAEGQPVRDLRQGRRRR